MASLAERLSDSGLTPAAILDNYKRLILVAAKDGWRVAEFVLRPELAKPLLDLYCPNRVAESAYLLSVTGKLA